MDPESLQRYFNDIDNDFLMQVNQDGYHSMMGMSHTVHTMSYRSHENI